jgi:hypothetical protein
MPCSTGMCENGFSQDDFMPCSTGMCENGLSENGVVAGEKIDE